jgi:phosphatidate phosphatase APP1
MMKTTLYAYKIENANTQDSIKVSGKLLNKGKAVVGETVTILVNGQTYTATTNKDGYFQVNVKLATAGENQLTVTYAGSDAYLAAQYNSTFTTKAKTSLFAYTLSEATVGSPAKISGKLQSNKQAVANKEVTVKVGTTTYTATTNKDGYYSVSYTPSAAGTENVVISFAGDDEYLTSSYNTTLTVKE